MKTLEEMTKEELYQLCVELMVEGSEVQGCTVLEYAEKYHNIKW